jgi:hypothetical protein
MEKFDVSRNMRAKDQAMLGLRCHTHWRAMCDSKKGDSILPCARRPCPELQFGASFEVQPRSVSPAGNMHSWPLDRRLPLLDLTQRGEASVRY